MIEFNPGDPMLIVTTTYTRLDTSVEWPILPLTLYFYFREFYWMNNSTYSQKQHMSDDGFKLIVVTVWRNNTVYQKYLKDPEYIEWIRASSEHCIQHNMTRTVDIQPVLVQTQFDYVIDNYKVYEYKYYMEAGDQQELMRPFINVKVD